jgi:carboxyl-terminal processing protease
MLNGFSVFLKKMMWILLAVIFAGCLGFDDAKKYDKPVLSGIWKSEGFGFVLDISDTIDIYQITASTSRIFAENLEFKLDPKTESFFTVPSNGMTLRLVELKEGTKLSVSGAADFYAVKISELPVSCQNPIRINNFDPVLNFTFFSECFDENYAFFSERGINWLQTVAKYKSQVTQSTTNEELLDIFTQMIAPLKDVSTSIETPDSFVSAGDTAKLETMMLLQEYYSEYLMTQGYTKKSKNIYYKIVKDKIAHICIFDMSDNSITTYLDNILSELDGIPADKVESDGLAGDEPDGIDGIVFDLRFAGGGFEFTANMLVSRLFTGSPTCYYSSVYYSGNFTKSYLVPAVPDNKYITSKAVILTSRYTSDAAENMVLSLKGKDKVKIIGEATNGSLSPPWSMTMPNGWTVNLSNQKLVSKDKEEFEVKGVSPDIVSVFDIDQFTSGTDKGLAAAITEAEKKGE